MLDVEEVRAKLERHRPRLAGGEVKPFAAVAMILAGGPVDPDLLFIERARRCGDPWSGQMAFPGGRIESGDRDLRCTAERETREEVGIELSQGELLGRLDDQEGRRTGAGRGRVIAGWVYHLERPPALRLSHEVEEALWVPSSVLLDPEQHVTYDVEHIPGAWPGILVGHPERHIVWGLTLRFLRSFLAIVGAPS